jgi:striatin 1/3/4
MRHKSNKRANVSIGVMRFLQTEWHRHERDRNAWEIERAEMKTRIAKLEGDGKKSRQTHDALSKHIKMLEMALRKEREKVKGLSKGEEVEMKDAKELAREQLKAAGKGMLLQ